MKKLMVLIVLFLVSAANADSALEILKKAHLQSYYLGNDGMAQLSMKVYPRGATAPIKKLFYMLRYDLEDGGRQKFFTYFVRPSDIKGTTFLVHKNIDNDDFRRLYIPASDKVVAIAGSRKQDPFMGSDFTYEDVSGRHYSKDNHKLIGEENYQGKIVYVTESIPKVNEDKIAKIKAWIDKTSYVPLKVEYTNHKGEIYRVYTSNKIIDIQGFPTIMEREMVSPLEGTKTIMSVNPQKVKYNINLTDEIFSERSLKNPPVKFFE